MAEKMKPDLPVSVTGKKDMRVCDFAGTCVSACHDIWSLMTAR